MIFKLTLLVVLSYNVLPCTVGYNRKWRWMGWLCCIYHNRCNNRVCGSCTTTKEPLKNKKEENR